MINRLVLSGILRYQGTPATAAATQRTADTFNAPTTRPASFFSCYLRFSANCLAMNRSINSMQAALEQDIFDSIGIHATTWK